MKSVKNYNIKFANAIVLIGLFIMWPFGALLCSLITFKQKFSRIIFVLFWGVWGYSRNLINGHDSLVWTREFQSYRNVNFEEFIVVNILAMGSSSTDFVTSLFSFGLSRLTDSTALFWFIHGVLFSILYVKSYPDFLKQAILKKQGLFAAFIIFILFIPITAYGVRFYYAVLIYIYAIVQVIVYRKNKMEFLLFLLPLIHFSFILMLGMYYFFKFTKNKQKMALFLLFTSAILFNLIGISGLMGLLGNLTAFQSKLNSYGNIDKRAVYFASKSPLFKLDRFFYLFYSLFIVFFFRKNKKFNFAQGELNLSDFNYFLTIFAGTLVFMLPFLDALDRFSIVFTLFTILYFTHVYVLNQKSRTVTYLSLFSLVFWGCHLGINYMRGKTCFNSTLLYNNLIGLLSGGTELPIIY